MPVPTLIRRPVLVATVLVLLSAGSPLAAVALPAGFGWDGSHKHPVSTTSVERSA